ncbi:PIN domain-containing protein [Candidatus Poriferisodalis sp.]|uniref:PIN domain-containing protein n=1 Tax=Candidatus Poriferisodalis sp. TaxID=3101277 RepID=UPI003B5A988E
MRLVVDTSVLVGELLREAGRERLRDNRLDLFLPERMWQETQWMLPARIERFGEQHGLAPTTQRDLVTACLEAVMGNVDIVAEPIYLAREDEARARSLRDPDDWPVVACALSLGAGVWTNDNDFLGTGVPTWTTATLDLWLQRADPADET